MSINLSTPHLDITTWKQRNKELETAISKEIKGLSESLLLIELPAIINMTQDQFDQLSLLKGIQPMFGTEDKLYVTPYNAMEVRVKDPRPPMSTVKEIV